MVLGKLSVPGSPTNLDFSRARARLISVEDVRNYLSHIIYILIFNIF